MADVLISQLPKTTSAGDSDLLIIDSFDAVGGGIVTSAIAWKDLYGKIASFPQGIKFPDGTALQPSITFVNDTNTGIYLQAPDTLGFSTSGNPRVVIDPAGNLGINTIAPEEKLHVAQGNLKVSSGSNSVVIKPADGGMTIAQTQNLPLTFGTNDLTRMQITSVGQILIGTSLALSGSIVNIGSGNLQVNKATFDGEDGGIVKIGYNPGTPKDVLHLNYDGAIGNTNKEFGLAGQVLTSGGQGAPWTWTDGGGGSGGSGVIVQPAPGPSGQPVGTLWYNTDNDKLYSYDGSTWNEVGSDGNINAGPGEPTDKEIGDLWYDTTNGVMYYWSGTEWVALIDEDNDTLGTVTSVNVTGGTGIAASGGPITDAGTINVALDPLGSDPSGTYTTSNITVDQFGRVTAASSGDAGDLPAIALDDLSDVEAGAPTLNYFLKWNGSNWVPDDVPVPDAVTYKGSIDLLNDAVPGSPSNGDLYINTGVGTISNNNWGADNNGKVLTGAESVYYNADNTDWDIISTGDAGVVSVTGNNGVTVDNSDAANPVVSLDSTYIDDPANSIKNVQADYTESDPTADSFIENKPTLGTMAAEDDATADGKYYVRIDGAWVELPQGNSSGPGQPGSPVEGQLWWDSVNNILMVYNGTDWVPVDAAQSPPVYVNAIEPAEKEQGDLWYEVDTDILKVYVNGAWISINPDSGTITPGPNEPGDKTVGDLWYDTGTNKLYVWNGSSWDEIETGDDAANTVKTTDVDQTIDGTKTFINKIEGTAARVDKKVQAGNGLTGGGTLTTDVTLTVDSGDGLTVDENGVSAVAGDDTIVVDAAGIKANIAGIFDPANANAVISFNSRQGTVIPAEGDYDLGQMGDVDFEDANAPENGEILKYVGSKWVAAELFIPGQLELAGTLDCTANTAPALEPGQYVINTVTGVVLDDSSWGILADTAISNNDMVAKMPDVDGQPPQWAIIGNSGGGGGGITSITAQNGVINQGTDSAVVLEADDTVVRTTGAQSIAGVKTFTDGIVSDVTGDLSGEAQDCSRSVLAGQGIIGGGKLTADVTINVNYGTSLNVVSDKLEAPAGNGLKNGSDGLGGLLTLDTDWLDANWAPGAIPTVGDGNITLAVGPGGGVSIGGNNATANQAGDTGWTVSLDNTVVRTSGDQAIGGRKDFNGVISAPNIDGDVEIDGNLDVTGATTLAQSVEATGTLTAVAGIVLGEAADSSNFDFRNLPVLP